MREKLHKILDLILDLREQGNDSFMYIYGHTGSVTVDINDGKWDAKDKRLYYKDEYFDGELCKKNGIDKLITKLEELKGETK